MFVILRCAKCFNWPNSSFLRMNSLECIFCIIFQWIFDEIIVIDFIKLKSKMIQLIFKFFFVNFPVVKIYLVHSSFSVSASVAFFFGLIDLKKCSDCRVKAKGMNKIWNSKPRDIFIRFWSRDKQNITSDSNIWVADYPTFLSNW